MDVVKEQKITIKVQSFDFYALDRYVESIVSIVYINGGYTIGPIPLTIRDPKYLIQSNQSIERKSIIEKNKHQVMLYIFDEKSEGKIIREVTNLTIPYGIGIEIKSQD